MNKIIAVKMANENNIRFFYSNNLQLNLGDNVIVNTSQGLKFGQVKSLNKKTNKNFNKDKLETIERKATDDDIAQIEKNKKLEQKAFDVCKKNIMRLNIPMKLINVEVLFDVSKILFFFTADGRVDFRELVKSLALIFKTRIELRQVGVRDKAKLVGGLGVCGREFCCKNFLPNFQPVSMKMAKEQCLSLNPVNVSGICGRLICCLKYEQETYDELLSQSPKVGALVETEDGKGVVTDINLIMGMVKVSLSSGEELRPKAYDVKDVKIIKDKEITLRQTEINKLKQLEDKGNLT